MLKRVQLMLDDDLDERIAFRAKVEGISRSEVVRRILRAEFPALPPLHEDPIWEMVGADPDAEPANVDDVVYGPLLVD
jgi:negative regulator of replication initiation